MKKIKIAKAIGLADEKYIAEAAPRIGGSAFWRKFTLVAACAALALLLIGSAIIAPMLKPDDDYKVNKNDLPQELRAYAGSEYLDVMIAFYEYDKKIEKKNSKTFLESLFDGFLSMNRGDAEDAPTSNGDVNYNSGVNGSTNESGYVETTDNQVEGVIEYDLLKRTKTHAFYVNYGTRTIDVYSIAGEESELVSSLKVGREVDNGNGFVSDSVKGVFLSEDGKTLTVLGNVLEFTKDKNSESHVYYLYLKSFDVSAPENIEERNTVRIMGEFVSARSVDGKILLMSKYSAENRDYSDLDAFLPQIDTGDGFEFIPSESIILPDELTSRRYMLVSQIDERTLSVDGMAAALCYNEEMYVSADKVFLSRAYTDTKKTEIDGVKFNETCNMTEIFAIGYGSEGFSRLGGISIEGRLKNQYSMDEYEGILRAVTTTNATRTYADKKPNATENTVTAFAERSNAALYCIDISEWEIVAQVRDFAPAGEGVESVRFDGTKAYVCTAEVITFTDPVYFFDLSDMSNITYTDTGVIEGYSSSLVDFGDGYLLGIGYGNSRSTLKIEIYEENNGKVESVCAFEREYVDFSEDYKSYYIDRERGWIGIGYYEDDPVRDLDIVYTLLAFNGMSFTELYSERLNLGGGTDYIRAFFEGDCLYIFTAAGIKVAKLS